MTFADRIAVMRAGRLEQEGDPEGTYRAPRTAFVAGFLGRTNLLRGEAHGTEVMTRLGTVPLSVVATGPVLVSLRPEDLALRAVAPDALGVRVTILERVFQGHDRLYRVKVHGQEDRPALQVRSGPGLHLPAETEAVLHVRGVAVPVEGSTS
jgi:ABC-type spermidine/putrescine transport systems, ATPase components